MFKLRYTLAVVLSLVSVSQAQSQQFGANDAIFLNFIGSLEAPAGFSDVYSDVPFFPNRPVEVMTIGEVLFYQELIRDRGTVSSAVGRYQFIYKTLLWLVNDLNIDRDRVFDSEMQTFLARHLMFKCGFYRQDIQIHALGNCLASRWAALPAFTGPNAGRSVYEGDKANNKALTTNDAVYQILATRFFW